jgi:uncharacterized protein (TIGR00730 family)
MSEAKINWTLCVFCGASDGKKEIYKLEAYALGKAMAERGIALVYGGGDLGVMGAISHGVHENGGKVTGVIPNSLYKTVNKCIGETVIVDTMHERKMKIYEISDCFLALPGGVGTLDELFEVLTWQQLGIHRKPIAVLNIDEFYDPLLSMLGLAKEKGFIRENDQKRVNVFQASGEVLDGFEKLKQEEVPQSFMKWDEHSSLKLI